MMSLVFAAGTVSSVIFAASNLPMLVKARRTRDLSSYSLAYLVMNNVGNLLYCLSCSTCRPARSGRCSPSTC